MSPELLQAEKKITVDKRTDDESESGLFEIKKSESDFFGILHIDSREDLFPKQDEESTLYGEAIESNEEAETQTEILSHDDALRAYAQMATELRQALLKLRGINRHLQRENEMVKKENTCLASEAHGADEIITTLQRENHQLKKEIERLKLVKADDTYVIDDTLQPLTDDDFEIDSLPFEIDTNFEYAHLVQQGSDDANEDVSLHLKLELKRDECAELQKDLEKFAEAFFEQSEELSQCQRRNKELQTENEELKVLKRVEAEVDAMWAQVKEADKKKSDMRDQLETLLLDRKALRASLVSKSNEVAELKKLQSASEPECVQSRIDCIQEDLKRMKQD